MAIASITKMAPRSSVPFAISCFVFRTNHAECRPRRNVAGSNFNSSSNDRGPEAFVRSGSAFGLQQYRHECRAIDCRSEEHTSDPVTNAHLVCRLLLEKKNRETELTTKQHAHN